MEEFSVPIMLGTIGAFIVYGLFVSMRRKDDFWQDTPKGGKLGRGVREKFRR